jgi:serine/threonine protein kinase
VTAGDWNQVKQVYEAALEIKASERMAFLEKECAGNPALRQEVQSLLNHQEQAEQFIESSAFELTAKSLAKDSPAGYLVGQNVGHYAVLSLIGAGGMGEVHRAKDTRLNRTVAIKVLSLQVANPPDQKQRLQREAKAIAALNHPHICVLHDIGQHEGADYLVMECLEGETLAQRLTKGALGLDHVLRYAIQIADAMDKAHRHGVVHRDLKPSNIMLTPTGVKLLDFGLAKTGVPLPGLAAAPRGAREASAEEPLTAQGAIIGTLQYMAPEQLEGIEADSRTDIFAFGAVLYEMVTGQKAFQGKSQVSVMAAIMDHVTSAGVVGPISGISSARSPDPDLSREEARPTLAKRGRRFDSAPKTTGMWSQSATLKTSLVKDSAHRML